MPDTTRRTTPSSVGRVVALAVVVLAVVTVGSLAWNGPDDRSGSPVEGFGTAAPAEVAVVDAVLAAWHAGDAEGAAAHFASRSSYVRMGTGETGIAFGRDEIASRIADLIAIGVRPQRTGEVAGFNGVVAIGLDDDALALVDVAASGTISRWVDLVGGPTLALTEPITTTADATEMGAPVPIPAWPTATPAMSAAVDRAAAGMSEADLDKASQVLRNDVSFIEVGTGGSGQIQGIEDVVRTNRLLLELGATYVRTSDIAQLGSIFAFRVGCPTCTGTGMLYDFVELDSDGRLVRYVTVAP